MADTAELDLAVGDGIFNHHPAHQPDLGPSETTVREKQMDIAETTGLYRHHDGVADGLTFGTRRGQFELGIYRSWIIVLYSYMNTVEHTHKRDLLRRPSRRWLKAGGCLPIR